jgi:DNA invertase Pin-like site-specific DNA recombinase
VSPAEQRQRIEAKCDRDGFQLIDTFEELDVSAAGAALKLRPGLSRALSDRGTRGHAIVVAYFERLSRSLAVQRKC